MNTHHNARFRCVTAHEWEAWHNAVLAGNGCAVCSGNTPLTAEIVNQRIAGQGIRPGGSKTPSVRKMRVDNHRAWNATCRRAGIEDFRFHDLRHTWASWLIQSGVPLSVLQEMGGWESIEMVRRYAHLAPNH